MAPGQVDQPRWHWIIVFVLAVIFFIQSFSASLLKSSTWDEPYHIASGLVMVQRGGLPHLTDHTPFLRLISGAALYAAGARLPATPEATRVIQGEPADLEFAIGISLLQQDGPDWVLKWARFPLLLLSTAMVFVIYVFGRSLIGASASLGAAFLYTFDPTIIAHSFLVTTDSGLTFFLIVFLLALWKYFERPNMLRLILCGVALGAVLGTKYTALIVLPITAVLTLAAAFWSSQTLSALWKTLRTYALDLAGMLLIAFLTLQAIYLFPDDHLQYFKGMRLINVAHGTNPQFFMAGQLARHFYSYYAVAYLFKEPIATIVLAILGVIVLLSGKTLSWCWSGSVVRPRPKELRADKAFLSEFRPRLSLAFLFVPAAAIFALYTFFSDDLCVRYIFPFLPFSYLMGGAGLAFLLQSAVKWKRAVGGVLCLWLIAAAIGIYPDHLSYFNELACAPNKLKKIGWDGGSLCGGDWLDECNVDWGQGLKQLKAWLDRNAPGRTVNIAYYGTFPPQSYGIPTVWLDGWAGLPGPPAPGIYAISAHFVASAAKRVPVNNAWLKEIPPAAIVGHAFYVYDIQPSR